MLAVLLLAACTSPTTGQPPVHRAGTHLMMDAYGHMLAVPDSQTIAASPPVLPAVSKQQAKKQAHQPLPATSLNLTDYIPLEEYEKQQATQQGQQQHFYVLPVGQGVAGETVLTSTHKTQTKQPMLSSPDEWKNDKNLATCLGKQPISSSELEGFAHWPARAYTTIKPGVSIHLVPEDLHVLTAGRVVVGLRYPKKQQIWHWNLYGFVQHAVNRCSFNPQAVWMDAQGHVLAEQDGIFTQSRAGSRISYPGWRGKLTNPAKTQYVFLVFTWPSTSMVPQFMVSDE